MINIHDRLLHNAKLWALAVRNWTGNEQVSVDSNSKSQEKAYNWQASRDVLSRQEVLGPRGVPQC